MQILMIAGSVGKDATLRRTQGGDAVLSFSLAVDNGKDRDGNRRNSTWYDCSIWGKRAESLERMITKGTKLVLTGRPGAREHSGKAYLQISVDQLTFQGGGERRDNSGSQDYGDSGYGAGGRPSDDLGDDIPFGPEWR